MLYPAELRAPCHRDGAEGNRTPDLLNAIQALSQLSYGPGIVNGRQLTVYRLHIRDFVLPSLNTGPTGLEPATSGVTVRHSNRLSYGPWSNDLFPRERATGLEPATST